MGLDGISINQLRAVPERNSAELNNNSGIGQETNLKIDGLALGQKIDPNKNKEHEKQEQFSNSSSQNNDTEEEEEEKIDTIKYDLSKTDKYELEVNNDSNEILIVEKTTKNVIQKINAEELSRFVNFLSGATGGIVNRKF